MTRNHNIYLDITPIYLNYFKLASITSVNIEHSFSLYNHILSNRGYNFQEHNLEIYIIINFNLKKIIYFVNIILMSIVLFK
jgi:hypothetical protein